MDIELELKIDEVIKRLDRHYDGGAYDKLLKNKEKINKNIHDMIYQIFRYDKYEYDYIYSSEFDDYSTPQIIILGAFPAVLLTDKPIHTI